MAKKAELNLVDSFGFRAALFALLLTFFVARFALLLTSWDANRNWEEPVFVFSAAEIAETGFATIFDHQDDLNHGGSVVMLAALVPWFRVFEANLANLKSFVIVWSGLTLLVFLVLLARHISATASLAFGILYVGFSPTLARINVTAVGSHPEALVFCGCALFAYLEAIHGRHDARRMRGLDFALGLASGVALWCSYVSLTFVIPLALCFLVFCRAPTARGRAVVGGVVGLLPWGFQNLWLRPHGALQWRARLESAPPQVETFLDRVSATLTELSRSFGLPDGVGFTIVVCSGAAALFLAWPHVRSSWGGHGVLSRRVSVPILLTPFVGFVLLVAADLPNEGPTTFYYGRFYVQLQVSLFIVLALAAHEALRRAPDMLAGAAIVAIAVGVWMQAPLYGTGNSYVPDARAERLAGCKVFGLAEGDRSANLAAAREQLGSLRDDECRTRAFGGLGWAMAAEFMDTGRLDQLERGVLAIADPSLRWAACGGIYFVIREAAARGPIVNRARETLRPHCEQVRPSRVLTRDEKPTHVIIIVIDTLRADHLGCYGYERETSPFLDTVASQGILFENARSNSSYTRESIAALMSGLLPSHSGAVGWNAHPLGQTLTLAERMAAAGRTTGFLSNTTMLRHPRFTAGFEKVRHLPAHSHMSGQGTKLSHEAIRYLEENRNEELFLYLHYLDPHGPYVPAKRYDERFPRERPERQARLYQEVRLELPALVSAGFGPGDVRFEDMVARYDGEIAATDEAVRLLFRGLGQLGLASRTLVVVTSDHGEEFLEHDFVEHAWALYEESIRVPLIFWAPKLLAPERVSAAVSLVDVAPTLLELAGVPFDTAEFDGRTLLKRTRRGVRPVGDSRTTIAETLIQERNLVRTIIDGNLKYHAAIEWLDQKERSYAAAHAEALQEERAAESIDAWQAPVHEEVYDLSGDPGERSDIVGVIDPGRLGALRDKLENYLRVSQKAAERRRTSTAEPREITPKEREQLRALGYL